MCNLFPFPEDTGSSLNTTSGIRIMGWWSSASLDDLCCLCSALWTVTPLRHSLPCLVIDIGYLLKSDFTACPKRFMMCGTTPAAVHCCHPAALRCSVFSAGHLWEVSDASFQSNEQTVNRVSLPLYLHVIFLPAFYFSPLEHFMSTSPLPVKCQPLRFAIKTHHISVRSLRWC